ncbi:hypothetical protein ACI3L1_09335 [Deinococcus sp. SM5_A1]|uniref:hypothetical protein n=1 Tax=Deinococcus sp. SM5_A1 TaxID=3379094 RepID=UPI003859E352
MSIAAEELIRRFPPAFPQDALRYVVQEYMALKREYLLGHWQPGELNGGRFAEGMVRIMQHLAGLPVSPLGEQLRNVDGILNTIENGAALPAAFRQFVPRVCKVLLNVRNGRDVAHIGGPVSPNHSDSKFVVACADWVLTELVRHYFQCPVNVAAATVRDLNELQLPVVAEVDGHVRVQNTTLSTRDKVLVMLLHRHPEKVKDADIGKWLDYGNLSRLRGGILTDLHREAFLHYRGGLLSLLPKGIKYVEDNVELKL